MFGVISATFVLVVFLIAARELAKRDTLWTKIPANCYALITTFGNDTGDLTQGGGAVTNIIHNVPGKRLIKGSHDLMKWQFVDGREPHGILHFILGIHWIGPFRTLRTNKIRRFRYSKRKHEKDAPATVQTGPFRDYIVEDDDLTSRYVPFSGEMAIPVTDAETKEVYELNFLFNVIEEAVRPLLAIRVADANSILAGMVKERINAITGAEPAETFIKATPESTKSILKAAYEATTDSEEEVGKRISRINLISTDMDEKDRAIFELPAKTARENAAAIAIAEKDKQVRILGNDADADRIERVVKPAAENDRTVAVRVAEAYENNKTVTTFAPGSSTMIPLGK